VTVVVVSLLQCRLGHSRVCAAACSALAMSMRLRTVEGCLEWRTDIAEAGKPGWHAGSERTLSGSREVRVLQFAHSIVESSSRERRWQATWAVFYGSRDRACSPEVA
jgi:hypothetical protein